MESYVLAMSPCSAWEEKFKRFEAQVAYNVNACAHPLCFSVRNSARAASAYTHARDYMLRKSARVKNRAVLFSAIGTWTALEFNLGDLLSLCF